MMRVRHKKWAAPYIQAHPQLIVNDPDQWTGRWEQRFSKTQPLNLEIGTGKGRFINTIARERPQVNFLGIEMEESVIAMALRKTVNNRLPNIQYLLANGNQVADFFSPHSIQRMFLNFSDPWPKRRHTKRRLTSPRFLAQYRSILKPGAPLEFKTDNRNFFEYSLKSFNNFGLVFDDVTLDLHHSPENKRNIITEYELKTMHKGPIYRIVVHFKN